MNAGSYWIRMSGNATNTTMRQPITKTSAMMNSALRPSESACTDSERKMKFRHAYTHIYRIDVHTILCGSLLLVKFRY